MAERACLCGRTDCRHRRHVTSPHHGAYGGEHQRRRARLLEDAARNPERARCARCGLGPRAFDPWEGGHVIDVIDGAGDGALRLEHRSCNRRAGAELARARARRVFS